MIEMARKIDISDETVGQVSESLKALPKAPKRARSLGDVIEEMKREILDARKKGYTFAEISEVMAAKGLEIKEGTLKAYMSKTGGAKKRARNDSASSKSTGSEQSAFVALPGPSVNKPEGSPNTRTGDILGMGPGAFFVPTDVKL